MKGKLAIFVERHRGGLRGLIYVRRKGSIELWHKSFWNRNSFWYYEKGNAHYDRFAKSYGVKACFIVDFEKDEYHPDKIEKLSIILRKAQL
ncbi:MAG: hypothetical protein Q8K02_02950, partial [Flavobacterium sp.]|nr:hypothetical protein [Flavobacterium sp.]